VAIIYGRADSEKQLLSKYPKRVQKIEDIERVHQEMKEELKVTEKGFFAGIKRWNKQRQVNKFEKNKDNPFHAGAKGELSVIDKLSELSDDYHVLCGLNIGLDHWVTYNGKKNLRSAQMDFVVVSYKGVILIEVKNWSTRYYNEHRNISPHEQVDRARRECANRIIGKTTELRDRRAVTEMLGDPKILDSLWDLEVGQFYVRGDALTTQISKIQVDFSEIEKVEAGVQQVIIH